MLLQVACLLHTQWSYPILSHCHGGQCLHDNIESYRYEFIELFLHSNDIDLIRETISYYIIHFRMAKAHECPLAVVCMAVSGEA